jgi:hypothetical protein
MDKKLGNQNYSLNKDKSFLSLVRARIYTEE